MTQAPVYQPPMGDPKAAAKAAKAYAKATRPWYKKKRFLLPLALVVIVAIAMSSGGGADDGGPKLVDDSGNADTNAGTNAGNDKAAAKDDAAKPGEEGNPVKVGQTVELEGTRYTVDSVEKKSRVGDQYFGEDASGIYVVVGLTIENTKDESKVFSESAAKLAATDGTSYSTDTDATIMSAGDGQDPLFLTEMHPDLPVSGTLIFDVPPTKTQGALLEVSDLFGGGEAYIALGLKK